MLYICPVCRTPYSEDVEACPADGRRPVLAEDFWSANADPMLGRTIAGKYTLLAQLGVGGMGTVYRAEQSPMGRMIAVKVLKEALSKDADTVTRFHREAKATSLLCHPNTVTVFDFGQTKDGLLYLAMELLDGELLTRVLERERILDNRRALSITSQVLGSLAEAHEQGIIHRDLKPDNVFVTRLSDGSEHIRVLDFGIAKVFQEGHRIDTLETQAGVVFGTPRYMSPEQAQSKPLDGRSDLYSVGVLLYQMVAGRPPFEDEDAVVVMARHIKTRPIAPREASPDISISERTERLILRALEKDAERRPASAREFMAEVDACLKALRSEPPPLPIRVAQAPAPAPSRAPIWIALGVGAGGSALAVALVALLGTHGASPPATPSRAVPSESSRAMAPSGVGATPPPEIVAPRLVRVELTSEPAGAEVQREGESVGTTPIVSMEQPGERPVRFVIAAPGFQESVQTVVPQDDVRLHIVLIPAFTPRKMDRLRSVDGGAGPYRRFDQL